MTTPSKAPQESVTRPEMDPHVRKALYVATGATIGTGLGFLWMISLQFLLLRSPLAALVLLLAGLFVAIFFVVLVLDD